MSLRCVAPEGSTTAEELIRRDLWQSTLHLHLLHFLFLASPHLRVFLFLLDRRISLLSFFFFCRLFLGSHNLQKAHTHTHTRGYPMIYFLLRVLWLVKEFWQATRNFNVDPARLWLFEPRMSLNVPRCSELYGVLCSTVNANVVADTTPRRMQTWVAEPTAVETAIGLPYLRCKILGRQMSCAFYIDPFVEIGSSFV